MQLTPSPPQRCKLHAANVMQPNWCYRLNITHLILPTPTPTRCCKLRTANAMQQTWWRGPYTTNPMPPTPTPPQSCKLCATHVMQPNSILLSRWRRTVVWINQESRRKYWVTRSSVRSFAHFAHFAHSLAHGKVNLWCLKMTWFCPIVRRFH